jgi:hypothetical protein
MLIAFKDRKTSEAVITVGDTGVEIPENIKDNCLLQYSLQSRMARVWFNYD